ncbi:MAG: bifunctional phosphoribosyl-AMP cyclohydrolase/phosphoribosyl-ATP diphosphatase HisIE [Candidatus Woesearchaeota archaeon]|nr:bifunctional phosphoribosyl-AMP cyclohydrolase/phosphoribosyl-ATP diphosphatase HisIE [Candidatus Woesearchaeota archaeon]
MIIPSIDIMNGKAVQLVQGKEKALESAKDPLALAKEFNRYGEVAVIDLDAALGKGENSTLIKELCRVADCRVGGGIRTVERANDYLAAGAKKIILGTKATQEFLQRLPKERVIVAIDTKDGVVVTEGWRKSTKKTPQEQIDTLSPYCSGFLYTNVNREGCMQGVDFEKIKELNVKSSLTVAGGITTTEDIQKITGLGYDAQVGMALYTGKLNLATVFCSLIDFDKCDGLVPTIVQDKQVLMLAYSTRESLEKALTEGTGTYFSRSRNEIWTKGLTSGNRQELVKARYDCDRDTVLFTVQQKNGACHTGGYSCFGEQEFTIDVLYDVIAQRIANAKQSSFTAKLAADEQKIMKKISEETQEVVTYTDKANLVWELADLTYFMYVLMAKNNITPLDVKNELWKRRK